MANKSLYVHNGLAVGSSVTINGSSGNISTTGIVTSTNVTNATSTITGALQVRGGAGIGGNLHVGGALDVSGDVTISDKIIHSGDTNTAIRFPAADTFTVETNGSERMRISSTGGLSVGTTTAASAGDILVQNDINAATFSQRGSGVPRSNLGTPTVTEMALFQEQFNNKTEFHPPANVIFETSTDGTTWTTFAVSDAQKKLLVGGDSNASIGIPYNTPYFRIRFIATNYVFLNALYSYWSGNGHSTQVQIYRKLFNSTTWIQHTNSTVVVNAWPGHLWLPFETIGFHPSNPAQNDEVAVVFIPVWNPSWSSNTITLSRMQIWGGYPAGKRTIYSVDSDKNVTFPANLVVSGTTTATSTNTGALQVAGGVGIGGNLHVGGEIFANKLTIQLTTVTTTLIETDDIIKTTNVTQATATATGALQIAGGASVGGNLWVGGQIFGNVGVAVATATNSLNVATAARTTNAAHYLAFVDSNNAGATYESVYTTSTFRINPSGRGAVYIGGGDPGNFNDFTSLQVGGPAIYANGFNNLNISTNIAGGVDGGGSTGTYAVSGNPAARYQQVLGVHTWYNAPAGTAGNTITWNPVMTINTLSNVGIGTTSPSTKLDVNGVVAKREYALYDTGGTASWISVGRFSTGAQFYGVTCNVKIFLHQGYNSTSTQDSYVNIFFKTSNGSSVDSNGFMGNGWHYVVGNNAYITADSVKWVSNAAGTSATSYTLYINAPAFTFNSMYEVSIVDGTSWTNLPASASNPGNSTSTVLISSPSFNVLNTNVGIGTSSPATTLDVGGDVTIADRIIHSGDTNTAIRFPAADTFTVETNGSERFRVDSAGNVGIGTSSPGYKLDVVSNGDNTARVGTISSSTAVAALQLATGNGTSISNNVGAIGVIAGESIMRFMVASNAGASLTNFNNFTKMAITSAGLVGIGTTTPYGSLTVRGTSTQVVMDINTATDGAYSSIAWNGSNISVIDQPTAEIRGYRTASGAHGALAFHTRGVASTSVEHMRITSAGLVGIGTNSPAKKLDVRGDALFTATSAPTSDIVTISNVGYPVATAGANALQVTYVGGNGAIEASAIRADMTPGTTSTSIWSAFRVAATAAAGSGVTFNGVKFDTKSAGAGTSNALWVGTGYDNILNYNGTTVINGTGQVIAAQITGAVASATNATTSVNIAGGTAGSIPIQSGAGTTSFIPIGSAGQILQVSGTTATWVSTGSLTAGIATSATTVATIARTTSATHYLTFVDSNNATSAYETVYTTSSFSINPSNGNVGIGTSSPTGRMHVSGTGFIYNNANADPAGGVTIPNTPGTFFTYNRSAGLVDSEIIYGNTVNSFFRITSQSTAGVLTERMRIDVNGNVGIGTTNPGNQLTVSTATAYRGITVTGNAAPSIIFDSTNSTIDWKIGNSGNDANKFAISTGSATAGELFVIDSTGNVGIGLTSPTSKLHINGDARISGVTTVSNTTVASSTVTGALIVSGGIGVGNNVYIAGSLFATTKSFLIDHPTKPGKKLRYGSLEGPENGVYVRGRVQGTVIELPEYWTKLVDPESITVNLTPIGRSRMPRINRIENNRIYLNKPWFGQIDCYYIVFAERNDIEKLEPEI